MLQFHGAFQGSTSTQLGMGSIDKYMLQYF